MEEYHKRGYSWPLPETVPNTEGWNRLMRGRMQQISSIDRDASRFAAWRSVMTQALVAPNFTEHGWALTRAPDYLVHELKLNLYQHKDTAKNEHFQLSIHGNNTYGWKPPLFIKQEELNQRILDELKPIHEAWVGRPLVGEIAYGLRVYQDKSILNMHVDKMRTHIISSILHVDHSSDASPWPIYLEDYLGNTNEIVMEPGDMLLYESSKCLHGRPKKLDGSWYSSLFLHYYPADDWDPNQREDESYYAVPTVWRKPTPPSPLVEPLEMVGMR